LTFFNFGPGFYVWPYNYCIRTYAIQSSEKDIWQTRGLEQCFPTFFSSRPTFNASFIVPPTMRYDQTFATHF